MVQGLGTVVVGGRLMADKVDTENPSTDPRTLLLGRLGAGRTSQDPGHREMRYAIRIEAARDVNCAEAVYDWV